MKPIHVLLLATTVFACQVHAQSNTFPSSGNVGIGIITPTEKVHVAGHVLIEGNYGLRLWSNDATDPYTSISFGHLNEAKWVWDYGTGTSHDLRLMKQQGGTWSSFLSFDYDNNNIKIPNYSLGIGTGNPEAKLHVRNNAETGNHDLAIFSGHTITGLYSDRFNRIVLRNRNGQQSWLGVEGSGNSAIGFLGLEHWDDVVPVIAIVWTKLGNVGIGTTSPDSKLTVKGTIHTQEVKVDLNGAVAPDYVFADDYNLPELKETEAYIKANKHLPGIPSAAEMEEDGINLKEMNLKLLEKVEELTLYLIEMKKENEKQKEINQRQEELLRNHQEQINMLTQKPKTAG